MTFHFIDISYQGDWSLHIIRVERPYDRLNDNKMKKRVSYDSICHHGRISTSRSKKFLSITKDSCGYIPQLIGLLANAPTALEAPNCRSHQRRNNLTPVEREAVQITAAVAMVVLSASPRSQPFQSKHKSRWMMISSSSPQHSDWNRSKLDTLAKFTLAVINTKGRVGDEKPWLNFWKLATRNNALDVSSRC